MPRHFAGPLPAPPRRASGHLGVAIRRHAQALVGLVRADDDGRDRGHPRQTQHLADRVGPGRPGSARSEYRHCLRRPSAQVLTADRRVEFRHGKQDTGLPHHRYDGLGRRHGQQACPGAPAGRTGQTAPGHRLRGNDATFAPPTRAGCTPVPSAPSSSPPGRPGEIGHYDLAHPPSRTVRSRPPLRARSPWRCPRPRLRAWPVPRLDAARYCANRPRSAAGRGPWSALRSGVRPTGSTGSLRTGPTLSRTGRAERGRDSSRRRSRSEMSSRTTTMPSPIASPPIRPDQDVLDDVLVLRVVLQPGRVEHRAAVDHAARRGLLLTVRPVTVCSTRRHRRRRRLQLVLQLGQLGLGRQAAP